MLRHVILEPRGRLPRLQFVPVPIDLEVDFPPDELAIRESLDFEGFSFADRRVILAGTVLALVRAILFLW